MATVIVSVQEPTLRAQRGLSTCVQHASPRQCPEEASPTFFSAVAVPTSWARRCSHLAVSPSPTTHVSSMPFKLVFRKQRTRRSCPATSDDQPTARKYYLGDTTTQFVNCFWPDGTTVVVSDPAFGTHDEIAMSTIQTSLAVLVVGSSLATKLPFIAPIAGLLLQVLTMRDARVYTHFL